MCSPEYYAVYNTKNVEQAPRVEISRRMSRRSGRIRYDSSISPCYTIGQE